MIAEAPVAAHSAPNFDRLARVYRLLEWASFGPFLSMSRTAFLPQMAPRKKAIVLGDGDGRFTARLLLENKSIHVDAIDASPAMLAELERRASCNRERLHSHCRDARDWQPSRPAYDLVISHFFLDCLTSSEVHTLAARVRSAAVPGAIWVISEFAIPRNFFGQFLAAPLVRFLYAAFHWMTGLSVHRLPDHASALEANGFRLHIRRPRLAGLLISELWMDSSSKP